MPFSKFEPHREAEVEPQARNATAARRAKLLKIGSWLTLIYTAIGFLFMGLFWLGLFP